MDPAQLKENLHMIGSKAACRKIVNDIGNDKQLFQVLLDTLQYGSIKEVKAAAWVYSHHGEQYPGNTIAELVRILDILQQTSYGFVKRAVTRVLSLIQIPEDHMGIAYTVCFNFCSNATEEIGVRAHSLYVLRNISLRFPELTDEVLELLSGLEKDESKGIHVRIRGIRQKLNKQN